MTITDPNSQPVHEGAPVSTPTTAVATFDSTAGSMPVITGGHLPAFMEWSKAVAVGSVIPDALRGKPADVLITVLHGLDLGLRPMQALNLVYVVKGRPSLSAEGMRALLLRDGHDFQVVECDDKHAVVRGRRQGGETWHEASFTIEQAKKAKLSGANWESYPDDMLLARATTRLCKRFFGDVIGGLPSTEEILDAQPAAPVVSLAQAAAERQGVNTETGEIIDAEVVDDAAEAERLRLAVLDAEKKFTAPAAETTEAKVPPQEDDTANPATDEPLADWDDVKVAVPGGAK